MASTPAPSLEGHTLLITGGTGSFGNAVLRRFLDTGISEVRIFSRDEKKQHDMRTTFRDGRVRYFIGDVRARDSVDEAMRGADIVFHAAALKQVPSCEFHPLEATRTNVLGTRNVLASAHAAGVGRVVCLSTDKAVYPINAMGMTKALMEKVMVAESRASAPGTVVIGTRYGNVMGSRGSVIPLFLSQILAGEALTVTDPEMTRFLMSLDEAVELVLHALAAGEPGDIFVQKAPGVTIGDLARALLELFGSDTGVRVIGTRHGEKLHETLLSRGEMARADEDDGYYRVRPDARELDYDQYFTEGHPEIEAQDDYTSENTRRLGLDEVKELLLGEAYVREALEAWSAR
jgi:UDP-glucose 4-epimerase